ncbi:unnamed protein product, partial [Discosporangium mesarthrocarpum]
ARAGEETNSHWEGDGSGEGEDDHASGGTGEGSGGGEDSGIEGFELVEAPGHRAPSLSPLGTSGRVRVSILGTGGGGREEGEVRSAGATAEIKEQGVDGEGDRSRCPSLLAMMLVSKSFLKHLPSLLTADGFHELWQQVSGDSGYKGLRGRCSQ